MMISSKRPKKVSMGMDRVREASLKKISNMFAEIGKSMRLQAELVAMGDVTPLELVNFATKIGFDVTEDEIEYYFAMQTKKPEDVIDMHIENIHEAPSATRVFYDNFFSKERNVYPPR